MISQGCRRILTISLALAGVLWTFGACGRASAADKPHVVFVVGDHEYRSESTMPPLAKELEEKFGMKCTVRMAQPDPRTSNSIPGLEVLKQADAMVVFLRWRELPEDQLNMLMDYVNKGGPVVAFRTSTHATKYAPGHPLYDRRDQFGMEVCGQKWLSHYGHDSSTDVWVIPEKARHPILKGVQQSFHCPSWLYSVQPLPASTEWLMMGKPVNTKKVKQVTEKDYNPVAWTWEPKGGRVFYTSLGHPDDFKIESVRRLAINAVHWVLGRPIPDWK